MPAPAPRVSIVILSLNKWAYTERCLESLLSETHRPLEFILVDNGSSDETPARLRAFKERARRLGIEVTLQFNPTNLGAATGRNQGLELATGDFVVFLDNDIVIRTRSWLQRMLGEFNDHPDTGVVCPKLIYPFAPFLIQYAGLAISPNGRPDYVGRGHPKDDPQFNHRRELQASISAVMMVPTPVIEKVGPLDEQFNPVQFEDIDYCYRIRQLGKKVIYLPSVEMYHFENVTTDNTPGIGFKKQTVVNKMKFARKWRHVFSEEGGPPDSEIAWAELPKCSIHDIGELETIP